MPNREFIDLQQALAGEYSLERELGRGGMGIVYLAREVQLDRLVAIKVLPAALAAQSGVRERFLREARIAASLSHPHIVPIHRVGEANGFVFFVMTYVSGETLGERLRSRGPLSTAVATRLVREVTWALSYAHGRGIVHRDIKPDNILIEADTGRALVSDFGIARDIAALGTTDPGRAMGTAHFMSPEQAANASLDGRSDLYSLGVVAHLALSGTLPPAPNATSSPTVEPSVSRALAAVIDRCLRADPADRFATGEELADALERASAPARAKLPMALRVWTQARDPFLPYYLYWSGGWTVMLATASSRVAEWPILLAVPLTPLVPITVFHARKAYQALSAGYTLRDLRAALSAWQQERREELAFERDAVVSRWGRVARWLTYAFWGATGVAVLYVPQRFAALLIGLCVSGLVISFSVTNAMGVSLISKRVRPKLIGAVRSIIWNSRVGAWAAKLLTPRHRKAMADLDYRPTEMALGLAAEELFAALPKAYREHLSDLPKVVRVLEAHAAAARARVDEISAMMSVSGGEAPVPIASPELVSARDAARRQLGQSVAALEAVRLDLLRLHGGVADLHPITTALDAARELGEALRRLDQAHREVDDAAVSFPLDLRPHTPA
jgi:serine/threonine-protein kinase